MDKTRDKIIAAGLDPDAVYILSRLGERRAKINVLSSFEAHDGTLWIVLSNADTGVDICRSTVDEVKRFTRKER